MSAEFGSAQESSLVRRFGQAAAKDLRILASLHGAEPDAETLSALREQPFRQCLGLTLGSSFAKEAFGVLDGALKDMGEPIDPDLVDALAADYANIYLTYAYRASPCESVWFDDDGLERQGPMFQVRGWYRRHGVAISDTMKRSDDHLVFQLQFVARLLELDDSELGLREAVRFMDEHLLRWLGQFCGRVAARCEQPYFAGLALLTATYAEELRDYLAEVLSEPRPSKEEIEARLRPAPGSQESPTPPSALPAGPGW